VANASKKHHGPGVHGKGDGSGANTELNAGRIGDNAVLSNRDKAQHQSGRGQDGRWNQAENYQESAGSRDPKAGQTGSRSKA
jgi:hypothetical protein